MARLCLRHLTPQKSEPPRCLTRVASATIAARDHGDSYTQSHCPRGPHSISRSICEQLPSSCYRQVRKLFSDRGARRCGIDPRTDLGGFRGRIPQQARVCRVQKSQGRVSGALLLWHPSRDQMVTVNRNFICLEITKWDGHRIWWRWAGRRMRQENTRRPLDWNLNLKWTF